MKILVVSDSHGDHKILQKLVHHYQEQVAAFIHCGDSELAYDSALREAFTIVGGNMDFDQAFPQTAVQQVGDETIFVAHGHLLGVNYDLTKMRLAAEQAHATIACYGHTHQLACELVDGRLYLNPGSISQPRGHWASLGGTYAVVTTAGPKLSVQYYDRELAPVTDLHFEFTR